MVRPNLTAKPAFSTHMTRSTAHVHAPAAPEPTTTDLDPSERLADLRRRRADVVDVLVETLFEWLADRPIGPRQPPAPVDPADGEGDAND